MAAACVLAAVVFVGHVSRQRIRDLDSRVHVISASVVKGTNQVLYVDSQLSGRVKSILSSLRLPVKAPTELRLGAGNNELWLCVLYKGKLTEQEHISIEALLLSSSGQEIPLYDKSYVPERQGERHLASWLVNFNNEPLKSGAKNAYTLRLRLPSGGGTLVEIDLGRLQEWL